MIKITCTNCGKHLEAPDEAAGKRGRCPECGEVFHLPSSETARKPDDLEGIKGFSDEASALVSEALGIIEAQTEISSGFVSISSSGPGGEIMEAAKKLKSAAEMHPDSPLFHYAYASCLHMAIQYKSAEEEMHKCAKAHPGFIPAQLAIEGWDRWQSMLALVPWGPDADVLHPAISRIVKKGVLLEVRDYINPRAAIFFRDVPGEFSDVAALRSARIDIATVLSPVNKPQVVGIYLNVYDNPGSPYTLEVLQAPFRPRGDRIRSAYEYMCIQDDIDFTVINGRDEVLLNKRLPVPNRMQAVNKKLFAMLHKSDGEEISDAQFARALQEHQDRFQLSDVRY